MSSVSRRARKSQSRKSSRFVARPNPYRDAGEPRKPMVAIMPDGLPYVIPHMLTPGYANTKLAKNGLASHFDTVGITLAPAQSAGVGNLCVFSTTACRNDCLKDAGRTYIDGPVKDRIEAARIAKTRFYFQDRQACLARIHDELD